MTLLLSVLLAATPVPHKVVASDVDIVEVNHCFDSSWNLMFDLVIWWELTHDDYRVVDWRILHNVRGKNGGGRNLVTGLEEFVGGHATPHFCHSRRRWISFSYDEKCHVHREVLAIGFRETHTCFDPELKDRARHPERQRRRLCQSPK